MTFAIAEQWLRGEELYLCRCKGAPLVIRGDPVRRPLTARRGPVPPEVGGAPSEQAEVIEFAYRLDAERMLSGKELAALARRIIDTANPAEKLRIREELTRGFYGGKADA